MGGRRGRGNSRNMNRGLLWAWIMEGDCLWDWGMIGQGKAMGGKVGQLTEKQ